MPARRPLRRRGLSGSRGLSLVYCCSFGLAGEALRRLILGRVDFGLAVVCFLALAAVLALGAVFFLAFVLLLAAGDPRPVAAVLDWSLGTALPVRWVVFARFGERIFALAATSAFGSFGPSLIAAL